MSPGDDFARIAVSGGHNLALPSVPQCRALAGGVMTLTCDFKHALASEQLRLQYLSPEAGRQLQAG
jgi:hypothetical protein